MLSTKFISHIEGPGKEGSVAGDAPLAQLAGCPYATGGHQIRPPPPCPASAQGKPASTLSPKAAPFHPGGSAGRSKAMRWSEDSECFDSIHDSDSPPPSYVDAVRRGSSVLRATSPMAGRTAVEEPVGSAVAAPGEATAGRKRRRRRRRARRSTGGGCGEVGHDAAARVPARQRLGGL